MIAERNLFCRFKWTTLLAPESLFHHGLLDHTCRYIGEHEKHECVECDETHEKETEDETVR